MQNDAEELQQLERDANAANQEVVQLADELEQRDERIEQLQEDVQGREQLLRQQEERLANRYGAEHIPCTCLGGGPTRKHGAAMLLTRHGVREEQGCEMRGLCAGMPSWRSCKPNLTILDWTQGALLTWRLSSLQPCPRLLPRCILIRYDHQLPGSTFVPGYPLCWLNGLNTADILRYNLAMVICL